MARARAAAPVLTSVSFAHPAIPAEARARASKQTDGSLAFLLTTCLRVEIVTTWPLEEHPVLEPSFRGHRRLDEEAFLHLCRVAAGLESPLVGEPEVLGQFRRALALYRELPSSDSSLLRTLDAAIGVARRVRRLLGDPPRGSLATVAAALARPYEKVAVLGSGTMARAAIECLNGQQVAVFARRPTAVANLIPRPWEEAEEALASYPVVIAAFPGKVGLAPNLSQTLLERSSPLLLIDLGMPPAFTSGSEVVRYVGIDDLAATAEVRTSPGLDASLEEEASKAWRRLTNSARTSEVIAAMTAEADRAANKEVARFAGRLRSADDPEPVLRQLAHTVARRVLHSPISYLGSSGVDSVEVLAAAFGVDDE